MNFTSFSVKPAIRVLFPEGEGELYYDISDDQDPELLKAAQRAELEFDCELPEDIELAWVGETVGVLPVGSGATPVSGSFHGMGAILEATYTKAGGQHYSTVLGQHEDLADASRLAEALNAQAMAVEALQAFANEIVTGAFEGGSFDGGDIQDVAAKYGLLRVEQRETACGESCACSEYGFPSQCYRKTALLGTGAQPETAPAVQEVWSLNGENGSWDYASLGELIRDHYGHDCGSAGDNSSVAILAVGSTVKRAIVCKADPASFLQDAGEVQEWMAEQACQSDAGEWADNYPEVNEDAKRALGQALEPLKAWARSYCQPHFFTVKDIATHEVTEADVNDALSAHG